MSGVYVFTLAQVPVWISPWYLLIVYFFSYRQPTLAQSFAVAAAMTVSLLGHEFGHALTARRYNLNPKVLLHGIGGACFHDRAKSNREDAFIVAAGPLAGLAIAGLAYGFIRVVGPPGNPVMETFMDSLLLFNVMWSIFNLLPLWPMDGGQLYRLFMLRWFKPLRAEKVTHITAIVVLVPLVLWAAGLRLYWAALILGMMAFQNIRALREGNGAPVRAATSKHANQLLMEAEDAYTRGDDAEAIRLCHQLRSESNVAEKTLGRAWQILGVATTRREDFREALSYLKRAPQNREVVEALAQCFYQLDMIEELRELTRQPAFSKLPAEAREQVLEALAEEERATANEHAI